MAGLMQLIVDLVVHNLMLLAVFYISHTKQNATLQILQGEQTSIAPGKIDAKRPRPALLRQFQTKKQTGVNTFITFPQLHISLLKFLFEYYIL